MGKITNEGSEARGVKGHQYAYEKPVLTRIRVSETVTGKTATTGAGERSLIPNNPTPNYNGTTSIGAIQVYGPS